jgi:glutamine synthetase type III
MYVTWDTSKTRHNEVAPNQFELAPIFEETNLNCLLMDVMEKVAERHDLKVLFQKTIQRRKRFRKTQ